MAESIEGHVSCISLVRLRLSHSCVPGVLATTGNARDITITFTYHRNTSKLNLKRAVKTMLYFQTTLHLGKLFKKYCYLGSGWNVLNLSYLRIPIDIP